MNNNVLDALIFTEIKNNLNKNNYPYFDTLLQNLNIINGSGAELDNILTDTTIKKACCSVKNEVDIFGDEVTEYDVDVPYIDSTGKPINKKLLLQK